jgi:hypothetical protein
MVRARLAALWLCSLASGGCVIDASLDGKRCPCSEGYVCDTGIDLCVRSECQPAFTVSDVRVEWSTPNTIYLRWTPQGLREDFLHYEILVAENEDDLRSESGSFRRLGPETSNEYIFYQRPQTGDPMSGTFVRDLAPGTTYLLRVRATDTEDCSSGSAVVARRTNDSPGAEIVFFGDALVQGNVRPEVGTRIVDGRIEYHPAEDPDCVPQPGADPQCGPPVGVQRMDIDLGQDPLNPRAPGISGETFAGAFLEIAVASHGDFDSHPSEVSLFVGECFDDARNFELASFFLPASEQYVVLQVPLSFLTNEAGEPLTYADIDTSVGGSTVCEFQVGAQWNKTGMGWIDYARVRH